jgi:hypothetical protein
MLATEAKQSNIQSHSYTLNTLKYVLGILCYLAKASDCLNHSTLMASSLQIHENVKTWRKSAREIFPYINENIYSDVIKFGIDNLKKRIY